MATFDCLGIGSYFLYFKSSNSRWWKKIFKFFTVLLLYAFMASATNFHYFDTPEFAAPVLFLFLWLIIVSRKDSPIKHNNTEPVSGKCQNKIDQFSTNLGEEASIEHIEINDDAYVKVDVSKSSSQEILFESNTISNGTQYCRYCGKKIEVDSAYCKYCGKSLSTSEDSIFRTLLKKKHGGY